MALGVATPKNVSLTQTHAPIRRLNYGLSP